IRACRGTRKSRVNPAHQSIPAKVDRRRKRLEVDQPGQPQLDKSCISCNEHGELDLITPDERAKALEALQLLGLLERQQDDLEPPVTILSIELHQERHFIMTVRTPAPADGDDDHLSLKPGVGIGDNVAVDIRKAEFKG